jgi:hypothetical protein
LSFEFIRDLPGFFAESCVLFSTSQDLVIHWLSAGHLLIRNGDAHRPPRADSSHRPLLFKINEKGNDNTKELTMSNLVIGLNVTQMAKEIRPTLAKQT